MKKIFIVEDEENISDLIKYTLDNIRNEKGEKDYETFAFERGELLLKELNNNNIPNLLLLDIMLPEEDGLSILKKMKGNSLYENIPVILLTAKNTEVDKIKGLNLGADDYVTKPFSVMELTARINAILRRNKNVFVTTENLLTYKNISINTLERKVKIIDDEIILTLKEYELLCYLVKNAPIVLTREKIIEQVWGYDYEGETRTVDMHITTLRKKLGNEGKDIKTIRGIGYKIGD
ncbi:MAG: response regulator transcription factor [Lachnospirales bacterium]